MSKKLARLQCLPCDFRDSLQGTGILGSAQILELSINDLESYIPALQLNTTMFSAIKADIAAEVAPKTKTVSLLGLSFERKVSCILWARRHNSFRKPEPALCAF